jgi:hypothetical protein
MMMNGYRMPVACSAVTVAAFGVICVSSGPLRLAAVAILLGTFVGVIWFLDRAQFATLGPALGLALAGLILIGLALAAVGALTIDVIAAAIGASTLAASWAGTAWAGTAWASAPHPGAPAAAAAWGTRQRLPGPFAVGGAVIFATAAACAVHYSAASATADSDQASSPALWAYPAGDRIDVGVRQPAGQRPTSLRIVVTQAGVTLAVWKDVRVGPGQTWEATPIALRGDRPTKVIAFHGESVVASLSG